MEKLRTEDAQLVDSCSAVAGLSLGEYCALVFAGALTFEDGLKVLTPLYPCHPTSAVASDRPMVLARSLVVCKIENPAIWRGLLFLASAVLALSYTQTCRMCMATALQYRSTTQWWECVDGYMV